MTVFILTKPPYANADAYEALEAILVSGAFEQTPMLLFRGEGVLQLLKDQQATEIGLRSMSKGLLGLEHYEVTDFYACEASLAKYHLTQEQLAVPVSNLNAEEIRNLLATQTVVATF